MRHRVATNVANQPHGFLRRLNLLVGDRFAHVEWSARLPSLSPNNGIVS
jgi:hypothetical protein